MIKAEIIADSIGRHNKRLTTFVLTYPRMVHAEFMTHRMISKNSASSRAIPNKKIIQDVMDNPAMPVFWGKNQAGMQAAEELGTVERDAFIARWLELRDIVIAHTQGWANDGLHKQICNRPLESWFNIRVVASATDWDNFFFLRCHKAAQPEIQALADAMLFQYAKSTPKVLEVGEWHLPFADQMMHSGLTLEQKKKVSTARCARSSYLNFEGGHEPEKDYDLHDKLTTSRPGHWSPTEHLAECQGEATRHGNFVGWKQYRQFFPQENLSGNLNELLAQRVAEGSKYAAGLAK